MFFIREKYTENHWIDKDMPTDISIVDCIVVYTNSRNKTKKKTKKTPKVLKVRETKKHSYEKER